MSQITSGWRALLSRPTLYNRLQRLFSSRHGPRRLIDQFIRPSAGDRILDIGCGTARIREWLPADVDYWGYDISERYIAFAQQQFGERVTVHCALLDEDEVARIGSFDVVLMIGVLHHMDDAVAARAIRLARLALRPGGRLITLDGCYVAGQNPLARLLLWLDRGRNVREQGGYDALIKTAFPSMRGEIIHRPWPPYTVYVMEGRVP